VQTVRQGIQGKCGLGKAVKAEKTIQEIAMFYQVHSNLVYAAPKNQDHKRAINKVVIPASNACT
jgi:hypothetical protein